MSKTWKIILGVIGGLFVLFVGCGIIIAIAVDETASPRPVTPNSQPERNSEVPLFADASDGIQQFVGGQTMPLGTYEFKCGFLGNVSVQLGVSPYTISLKEGDQVRQINQGDSVTMGYCKAYGPQ